jgi:thiol-disulfide isomerase/thioredoxin
MKKIVIILSIILLFVACEDKDEDFISDDVIHSVKKDYTLQTLDNKTIKLEVKSKFLDIKTQEFKNQVILINFWATWCPPCRTEIPHFIKVVDKYKGKFNIIGVLLEDKDKKSVQKFANDFKINYPIAIGEDNFYLSRAISPTRSLPFSVLYDKNGNYVTSYLGAVPQEMLENDIEKALKIK